MNINDLELKDELIVTEDLDFDQLPEEFGPFVPPLYPGPYRFQLPSDLSEIWDKFDTDEGERVVAIFRDDTALTVTQSKNGEHNNEPLNVRISNRQRPRGRDKVPASDMDFLLRALNHGSRPRTNPQYVQALMEHAGQEFGAEVEWSAYCNPNKDIYIETEEGRAEQQEGTPGCGQSHYQQDIPKENGIYQDRFPCKNCGALVRAWPNLVRFKSVTE